jgi:hypothetical protein
MPNSSALAAPFRRSGSVFAVLRPGPRIDDQSCLSHIGKRHSPTLLRVKKQSHGVVPHSLDDTDRATAPVDLLVDLHLGALSDVAPEVFLGAKPSLDTRRGNLDGVGVRQRLVHLQEITQTPAEAGAILKFDTPGPIQIDANQPASIGLDILHIHDLESQLIRQGGGHFDHFVAYVHGAADLIQEGCDSRGLAQIRQGSGRDRSTHRL